jgi:cytochrome c oxidase assembly factor CtaG
MVVALLYAVGSWRLRQRTSKRGIAEDLLFWSGFISLGVALISPIHVLGTQIFTVHMIEHEILMVVSAPLLVAAKPAAALLWGMPRSWRHFLNNGKLGRSARRTWAASTELWSATLFHAVVLWVWHAPVFFRSVLAAEGPHILQHASFFFSAILFWAAVVRSDWRHVGQGSAVFALFLTSLQAGLLGALLTLSPSLWYPFAPDPFPICGLTRSEDQAFAGLIMWIPACSVYVIAALVIMARWLSRMEGGQAQRRTAVH